MTDALDAAIKASEPPVPEPDGPDESNRHTMNVTIASTQRHVVMNFPIDLTDAEVLELVSFVSGNLAGALRATRAQMEGPKLEIARAMPPEPAVVRRRTRG